MNHLTADDKDHMATLEIALLLAALLNSRCRALGPKLSAQAIAAAFIRRIKMPYSNNSVPFELFPLT